MKNLIKIITPKAIKKKLYKYYSKAIRNDQYKNSVARDKLIPVFELTEKHLQNLKVLPNRFNLLEQLPKNGVVAEIGVDKGDFSSQILINNQPKKLHLIDIWDSERYNQEKRKEVELKFEKEIISKNVVINLGYSTKVVDIFEDSYFDWIYIDTNHSYEMTKKELISYSPKIKEGGIIAGHDYTVGYWNGFFKFGVIEAVNEFCVCNDWEFVYLTMENREHSSFAIRKI